MNPKQIQEMMSRAQDMQRQMQEKMKETVVEASSGGGVVTVKMNGAKQVLSVKIDPEVVKSGDVEMLQDMVAAAVNEAARQADESVQSSLGGMLGGMGLPPGLF
ncbi:MAG TPA: YbaB/EbfC family nucleoid-associated protein [Terriglobales bacterium]|nr:YbaB/EbfC family nucleoid-associated protein [Terriglobales bacterium]